MHYNIAVIDIGSNSVRLVIYDGLTRSPIPLFNEKSLCGLARDMEKTGSLNNAGRKLAEKVIARFIYLAHANKVQQIFIFATSAVRDAKDGQEFVDKIQQNYGVAIKIFSGEQEAFYAALGVTSSISNVNGIVGDLGGGSFELTNISNHQIMKGISLPIGPLRMSQYKEEELSMVLKENIIKAKIHKQLEGKNFYAVGGGFRNLAKIHMSFKNYPLKVLHNYQVEADDLVQYLEVIAKQNPEELSKYPDGSKKRAETAPMTAIMLKYIIEIGRPKLVIFSSAGVREGVLFEKLSPSAKMEDPLIAGAKDMIRRISRDPKYGYELMEWMDPLFMGESENEKRLRLAAAMLSEISCLEHTEYRAEFAFRRIVDSSLALIDHKERIFIALALYHRYENNINDAIAGQILTLLSEREIEKAKIIGLASRLARNITAGANNVLVETKLEIFKKTLKLKFTRTTRCLNGDVVEKRLKKLADFMDFDYQIII